MPLAFLTLKSYVYLKNAYELSVMQGYCMRLSLNPWLTDLTDNPNMIPIVPVAILRFASVNCEQPNVSRL